MAHRFAIKRMGQTSTGPDLSGKLFFIDACPNMSIERRIEHVTCFDLSQEAVSQGHKIQ